MKQTISFYQNKKIARMGRAIIFFKIGFPFYNMGNEHYSLAMGPSTLNEIDGRMGDEPGSHQPWTVLDRWRTHPDPMLSNSTWPNWTSSDHSSLTQTLLYAAPLESKISHPRTSNFLCYLAWWFQFPCPKQGNKCQN